MNPACIKLIVLFVWVWILTSLDYDEYFSIFSFPYRWSQLDKEIGTSSFFHHFHEWLSFTSEMIEIGARVGKKSLSCRKVFAILKIIFFIWVIVLLVEHFFNLNININQYSRSFHHHVSSKLNKNCYHKLLIKIIFEYQDQKIWFHFFIIFQQGHLIIHEKLILCLNWFMI